LNVTFYNTVGTPKVKNLNDRRFTISKGNNKGKVWRKSWLCNLKWI